MLETSATKKKSPPVSDEPGMLKEKIFVNYDVFTMAECHEVAEYARRINEGVLIGAIELGQFC